MENSRAVPQKIKNRTTIWASNSTSGCLCKEIQTLIRNDICIPMFTAALFTIVKIWKQPKCPSINKQIKKMWYIHIMEYYYSAIKKNEILPFATTLAGPEGIILREISQTERDKHVVTLLICRIYNNNNKNWAHRCKQSGGCWRQGVGWSGGGGDMGDGNQKGKVSDCKINKSRGQNAQCGDHS